MTRAVASWRRQSACHASVTGQKREARAIALRRAMDGLSRRQAWRVLLLRSFLGWRGVAAEGKKHATMEEAVQDLSGIVTRLTGVDFRHEVGLALEAAPQRKARLSPAGRAHSGSKPGLADVEGPRAPPYQSPIGKVFNHLFEPPPSGEAARLEPATPILTPASKAACSAVLGWNQARSKLPRVPFDER